MNELIRSTRRLAEELRELRFAAPVACVYRPLDYAWQTHQRYLEKFGRGKKRVVFLGMNPGPFGMVQTGVPRIANQNMGAALWDNPSSPDFHKPEMV